jgi:5'-3' exonuclease
MESHAPTKPVYSPNRNTLLLIDGLSIVRRVYEAVPGEDTDAKAEGAMNSSWHSILRCIRETKPSHFMTAFDFGGRTHRHDIFSEYKVNRGPMPAPLLAALPAFKARMDGAGLKTLSVPGVEADDTVTTVGLKALARGFTVIIASTDKDLCRLIHEGIRIRDHFESTYRDEAWVQAKFGICSRLITDYLALVGDDTDGIPGVAGIGKTIAPRLLAEHGSLDGVLAAAASELDPIKGAVGAKLREQADVARMSRALATLKTDVSLGQEITPNDLRLPPAIAEILEERGTRPQSKAAKPKSAKAEAVAKTAAEVAVAALDRVASDTSAVGAAAAAAAARVQPSQRRARP